MVKVMLRAEERCLCQAMLMYSKGPRKMPPNLSNMAPSDCGHSEAYISNSQQNGTAIVPTTTRQAMPLDSRMGTVLLTHFSEMFP